MVVLFNNKVFIFRIKILFYEDKRYNKIYISNLENRLIFFFEFLKYSFLLFQFCEEIWCCLIFFLIQIIYDFCFYEFKIFFYYICYICVIKYIQMFYYIYIFFVIVEVYYYDSSQIFNLGKFLFNYFEVIGFFSVFFLRQQVVYTDYFFKCSVCFLRCYLFQLMFL